MGGLEGLATFLTAFCALLVPCWVLGYVRKWPLVQSGTGLALMVALAVVSAVYRWPWPFAVAGLLGAGIWATGVMMDLQDRDRATYGQEWWD